MLLCNNIFSPALSLAWFTLYGLHNCCLTNLHLSLSPAWYHCCKHHDLTSWSVTLSDVTLVSLHFSTQVMCCTQDSAHLKAHFLQAVVILSPSGRVQSIVVDVQHWLTYSVFTLQCLSKASRWGKWVAHNPLGAKRGNTFSAGNCVVNYVVWRVFPLPLCQCHKGLISLVMPGLKA